MTTVSAVTLFEAAGKTIYTLSYDEYNGLATFIFNHAAQTASLLTPHGLNWFVYSSRDEDDLSEHQAVEALLWPLQASGIVAFTPLALGRPVAADGYLISTSWVKIYFGDPTAHVKLAAMPGGMLYKMEKPEKGIVETLRAGEQILFRAVKGW